MPDLNSIENLAGQFTETDWNEAFSMSSPNKYSITRTSADVSLVGDIDGSKIKSCIQYLLGYSYVGNEKDGSGNSVKKLHRVTPAYHPLLTWLYCTAITDLNGRGLPSDKTQLTLDPPYDDTFKYGNYARYLVTAKYAPLPYDVKEDDQITYEYERYVEIKTEPYVEMLTLPQGQLLYDASYASSIDGNPIMSPRTRIKQKKTRIIMVWHEVPLNYICDSNGIPTKLVDIQKCVNKVEFLGKPAGTLLCEDVKIERGVFPVATDILDSNMLMATVTFNFIFFDPPRHPSETKRGHNLLPCQNGLYYPVKTRLIFGATVSVNPFETYTFADAFAHVDTALT
jgi:hypothetical protein